MSCFLRESKVVEGMNPVKVYIMNNKKHVAKYDSGVKISHSVFDTLQPKLQESILKRKADKQANRQLKEEKEMKESPKEPPIPKPSNVKYSEKERSMAEIEALFEKVKEMARSGLSYNELVDFWNTNISPKLDLYGAEYLSSGEASEIAEERWYEVKEVYEEHNMIKRKLTPPPIIPKVIRKKMLKALTQTYDLHEYNRGMAMPITPMIKQIKEIVSRSNENFWGSYDKGTNGRLAYDFIQELVRWINDNSYQAKAYPFRDPEKKEYILVQEDWEKVWDAND